jgi:carbonic anhydrase
MVAASAHHDDPASYSTMSRWAGNGYQRRIMALERLLKGFADFRLGYYREHLDLFERLASEGQSPEILIVACADARVDPGILTQTKPGDIFTVRNVGALVPPAQIPPDQRHHGTSAAIEFAVRGLEVGHVVVLGHALCGGIAALVDGRAGAFADFDYLSTWTSIAQEVRDEVVRELAGQPRDKVLRAVEQATVVNSVRNLMSFPWVAERVAARKLVLHAWWFNLTEGQLHAFNPAMAAFEPVVGVTLEPAVTRGTALPAIAPGRFVAALAGKKPTF